MNMNIIKRNILVFSIIIACISCNSNTKTNKKYIIGFSQAQGEDDWRKTMMQEMTREIAFHDDVEYKVKNAQANSQTQIKQIDELINEKVDILIVSPHETEPLIPILEKVYNLNIPIVLIDRRINSKKYTAFIGASNYEVGQNAAIYTISLLKGKGNVIEVTGLNTASPFIDRNKGFIDILSKNKGIKLIAKINDQETHYAKKLDSILRNRKDINAIFAHSDFTAKIVYQVCKDLGIEKRVKIIGVDGLSVKGMGMDMVANKIINATVLYPTGGQEAIQTAISILENKPYEKENNLESTIIDSTNIKILLQQSKKVKDQQLDIDKRQNKIDQQIAFSKNQTNIILGISITLAITLILSSILFYLLNENKKISIKLTIQKEKISDQRNKLVELVNKLKEVTDAKFNFFTNISHELRTPLTLILGPLEDTIKSSRLHFTLKNNLELAQRNAIRLLKLINQLMDYRKIEEGKMKINISKNNFGDFIEEIVNEFKELAKKKQISLNLINNANNLDVDFDKSMFDKILFNLLSNAFKFTKENGIINITIKRNDLNAIVEIEDDGIGMSPEDIEHAFDLFYQGHSSTFKGTGLGLSLSKELISAHKGDIKIKSNKGKGTCFTISLPIEQEIKMEEIQENRSTENYSVDGFLYTSDILHHNFEKKQKDDFDNVASILIIEDNEDLVEFLKNRLEDKFEVHVENNGSAAINKAFDIVPDLIISDIIMPGTNGLKVAETLKNDLRTSHIPIILLTAKTTIEDQIEGMKSQADLFISKPFNLSYLEESINTLLRSRSVLREHYMSELPSENRSNASNKLDRKFISQFTSIIEKNISNENLSVDDICKGLSISKVQLYRKTKALLGYNVNDYILSVRIQKAKYLLQDESYSISEIAYQVGFTSQGYFSTVFKSKVEVTPSEFREKRNL